LRGPDFFLHLPSSFTPYLQGFFRETLLDVELLFSILFIIKINKIT
jgi:hypothetical protein